MKKTLDAVVKNKVIIEEIIECIQNPLDIIVAMSAVPEFKSLDKSNAQEMKQFVYSTYNSLSQETQKAIINKFVTDENLRKEFKTTNIKPEDSSKAVFLELIYIKSKDQKPEIIKTVFDILTEISDKGVYSQNPEAQKFCIETFQQVIHDAPVFIPDLPKNSIVSLIKNGYITNLKIKEIIELAQDEVQILKLTKCLDFALEVEPIIAQFNSGGIIQEEYLQLIDVLYISLLGADADHH
jgi:hypothetical protein